MDPRREDIAALVAARDRDGFLGGVGRSPEGLAPELSERLPDLVSLARRSELRDRLLAAPRTSGWAELAWLEAEAIALGAREALREKERHTASVRVEELGGISFQEAEVALAGLESHGERQAARGPLEDAGGELAATEHEVAGAMLEAADNAGVGDPFDAWGKRRGRQLTRLQELARLLLDHSDAEFGAALTCWQWRILAGADSAWIELPWFLGGGPLSGLMPTPGQDMVAHLASSLGLRQILEQRLRFQLISAPGARPGPHFLVETPGNRVTAAWPILGGLRDYRGVVGTFGRSLGPALSEPRGESVGWSQDPAVGMLLGALFESVLREPTWYEATLRRPAPGEVVRHARISIWLRVRQLAAMVAAPAAAPAVLAMPSSRDAQRATGFVHGDGLVPWSCSVGNAADELAGWLSAPLLWDWFATRHGKLWSGRHEAGRVLRDVCAAGYPTLASLHQDLGLGEFTVEPLLDLWSPIEG